MSGTWNDPCQHGGVMSVSQECGWDPRGHQREVTRSPEADHDRGSGARQERLDSDSTPPKAGQERNSGGIADMRPVNGASGAASSVLCPTASVSLIVVLPFAYGRRDVRLCIKDVQPRAQIQVRLNNLAPFFTQRFFRGAWRGPQLRKSWLWRTVRHQRHLCFSVALRVLFGSTLPLESPTATSFNNPDSQPALPTSPAELWNCYHPHCLHPLAEDKQRWDPPSTYSP